MVVAMTMRLLPAGSCEEVICALARVAKAHMTHGNIFVDSMTVLLSFGRLFVLAMKSWETTCPFGVQRRDSMGKSMLGCLSDYTSFTPEIKGDPAASP
jgi:hypothetical protein